MTNHDPGLQPQRTTLAWTRTGVTTAACAAILARHALNSRTLVDIIAASLAGIAVAYVLLLARLRRDHITAAIHAGISPVSAKAMATTRVLISAVGVCEIISFLAGSPQ